MSGPRFQIDSGWVHNAAVAICSRNGIIMKDVIAKAEQGIPLRLESHGETTVGEAIHALQTSIDESCQAYLQANAATLRLFRFPSPNNSQRATANEERQECRETVVRVAVAGALVQLQRRTHLSERGAADSSTTAAAEAEWERDVQTTLLKGLLYAFESFQRSHSMNRNLYPKRLDNNTPGTVGWDTLVLLYFVHRIPQVARHANGSAIDACIGHVIRTWRKLLVALQSVDVYEAPEHSRRRGALALVNGLLIILFQRYNTHQCAVLLGAVEHAEKVAASTEETARSILHPSRHMISEVVTYYYYKGRMHLYERQLEEAHQALREAYTLLPPAGFGNEPQRLNKERVRFFLVVAGVASGRRIPPEILRADGDMLPRLFTALVSAIEQGDPVRFSLALDANASVFHRRGVYLILQQARIMCYLMLIARVHAAMAALPDTDNSRITISTLLAAYEFITKTGEKKRRISEQKKRRRDGSVSHADVEVADVDAMMDEDRMALWMAKLIARGYVRGYYSHEHKTLVLSKKAPFPLLQPTQ